MKYEPNKFFHFHSKCQTSLICAHAWASVRTSHMVSFVFLKPKCVTLRGDKYSLKFSVLALTE